MRQDGYITEYNRISRERLARRAGSMYKKSDERMWVSGRATSVLGSASAHRMQCEVDRRMCWKRWDDDDRVCALCCGRIIQSWLSVGLWMCVGD